MKLKLEVISWNSYFPTHTWGGVGERGGFIRLTSHSKSILLMDAKLLSGTTKYQKDIVSESKHVWST